MIYIEDKSFYRQIDLLEYFHDQDEFDLIIWFFAESKLRNICDLQLAPIDLIEGEQVSEYEEGFKPRKTRRVKLTTDLLTKIRAAEKDIKSNCDSLALYNQQEDKWLICVIEHEGMCLVRDDSLNNNLVTAGFNASLNKPDWW